MRNLKDKVEIEKRCAESGEAVSVAKNVCGRLVFVDIELDERAVKKCMKPSL